MSKLRYCENCAWSKIVKPHLACYYKGKWRGWINIKKSCEIATNCGNYEPLTKEDKNPSKPD